MSNLTKEKYEQQKNLCEGLCDITEEMTDSDSDLMRCVTCPFCKETVDAVLTKTTITCPKCSVTVNR